MAGNDKPSEDQRYSPGDFRDVFQYRKGDELRTYSVRVIPNGAELWRFTERGGQAPESLKEDDFTSPGEGAKTLQELEQRLRAGGWKKLA
jgi:hypothetical protein